MDAPMTEHTPLTESHIAAMRRESKATGKRLELPDVGKGAMAGLTLVCNPSGITSWVLRRRLPTGGNPLRFPIGENFLWSARVYPSGQFGGASHSACVKIKTCPLILP